MKPLRLLVIAAAFVAGPILVYLIAISASTVAQTIEVTILYHLPPGVWTRIKTVLAMLWIGIFWAGRKFAIRFGIVNRDSIGKFEGWSEWLLNSLVPLSLAIAIPTAFLAWFPHYLYWPWWMDLEHFAVSAHMWELGARPYRDLIDFNFPGPTYFMWLLGKTFGWDKPMIANAIDGLVHLALCIVLIRWSRKCFGSSTAGLFASFLIVRYQFSLDYSRAMQRDWYVAALGISSICIIQASRSKHRWLAAGVLMAVAGIVRPYAIMFLIPVGLACLMGKDDRARAKPAGALRFAAAIGTGTLLLWLPLVMHGIFDDFLSTFLKAAFSGSYKSETQESIFGLLVRQANTKVIGTGLIGIIAAAVVERSDPERFRMAIIWSITMISTLFYMPMCPVRHAYTEIPAELVACVACGIALRSLIATTNWAPSVKLVSILVWFVFQFPGLPQYCSFSSSVQAIRCLVNGEMAADPPPGCRDKLGPRSKMGPFGYCWEDYVKAIEYVRTNTTPETCVVNFLWLHPFPSINGPTGRPILWPCAEGFLWLRWVNPELESRFAASLSTDHPVVVITHDPKLNDFNPMLYPIITERIESAFEEITSIGLFRIYEPKRGKERPRSDPSRRPPRN